MLRKLAVTAGAAIIIAGTAGTAQARPIADENPNPGGGTVGLDCVFDVNTGGETCYGRYVPTHRIDTGWTWRNPFVPLWHDLTHLFG